MDDDILEKVELINYRKRLKKIENKIKIAKEEYHRNVLNAVSPSETHHCQVNYALCEYFLNDSEGGREAKPHWSWE